MQWFHLGYLGDSRESSKGCIVLHVCFVSLTPIFGVGTLHTGFLSDVLTGSWEFNQGLFAMVTFMPMEGGLPPLLLTLRHLPPN